MDKMVPCLKDTKDKMERWPEVKNTCCSYSRPRLGSQHPQSSSQPSVIPVLEASAGTTVENTITSTWPFQGNLSHSMQCRIGQRPLWLWSHPVCKTNLETHMPPLMAACSTAIALPCQSSIALENVCGDEHVDKSGQA